MAGRAQSHGEPPRRADPAAPASDQAAEEALPAAAAARRGIGGTLDSVSGAGGVDPGRREPPESQYVAPGAKEVAEVGGRSGAGIRLSERAPGASAAPLFTRYPGLWGPPWVPDSGLSRAEWDQDTLVAPGASGEVWGAFHRAEQAASRTETRG